VARPKPKIPQGVREYWKANKLDSKKMEELRYKCQTDLLFLAQTLGYPDLDEKVHREVCDFFTKKNPDLPFREWAAQDTSSHERLLMLSRGGLKSTIGTVCDSVQYNICWPDITILLINGKDDLGRQFIKEIREHFERQEDGAPRNVNGQPSIFQLAFPEFCTDGCVSKDSYTCPARTAVNIKEPTIRFGGVETDLSGPHYDVVKADDGVTNENSRNPTRLKTIRDQMSMHHKVRQPWGFFDNIGTWYDLSDSNGTLVAAEEKNKTLFWDRGKADSRDAGDREVLTHIMIRPCMWRKDGNEPAIDGVLNPEDWELWWPSRLSWKYLMGERVNLETFATQYMQNPGLGRRVRFTRDRLVKATRLFTEMPSIRGGGGLVVQYWDTANKKGNWWNNFSVGTTALILGGNFYFLDIVRGQFDENELPQVIANFAFKWRPQRAAIEDANGVRFLMKSVKQELEAKGLRNLWFEYKPISNEKDAKEIGVKPFAKALIEGRVVFSNGIPTLDYVYEEFEKFPNGDFDDVVDSVSSVVQHFGDVPEALVKLTDDEIRRQKQRQLERLQYNWIFGKGQFANVMPTSEAAPQERISADVAYDPSVDFGFRR
jgi:predicted phage terminase large subunit-like protein